MQSLTDPGTIELGTSIDIQLAFGWNLLSVNQ